MSAQEALQVRGQKGISPTSLILIGGALLIVVTFVIAVTAPFGAFLSESSYAPIVVFHGVSAAVLFVALIIGLYEGYRLVTGQLAELRTLRLLSLVSAITSFVTIIFGNWSLIGYREEGGARAWLRENNAPVHGTFFEFKEYIALFTLPLAILTVYLIVRYKDSLLEQRMLRALVVSVLMLTFFYFAIAFFLGASITKVRAV